MIASNLRICLVSFNHFQTGTHSAPHLLLRFSTTTRITNGRNFLGPVVPMWLGLGVKRWVNFATHAFACFGTELACYCAAAVANFIIQLVVRTVLMMVRLDIKTGFVRGSWFKIIYYFTSTFLLLYFYFIYVLLLIYFTKLLQNINTILTKLFDKM